MDLVEIGHIIPSGTGDYTFKYKPQEDVYTVWNGMIASVECTVEPLLMDPPRSRQPQENHKALIAFCMPLI